MNKTIGRCSICNGDVTIHEGPWGGIYPPVPQCSKCGATEDRDLPVIKMRPMADIDPKDGIRSRPVGHDPLLNQSERQRDLLSRW